MAINRGDNLASIMSYKVELYKCDIFILVTPVVIWYAMIYLAKVLYF